MAFPRHCYITAGVGLGQADPFAQSHCILKTGRIAQPLISTKSFFWTSYTFLKERGVQMIVQMFWPLSRLNEMKQYIYINIYLSVYTYSTYINIETTKHQPWEGRLDWLASQLQQRTCWEAESIYRLRFSNWAPPRRLRRSRWGVRARLSYA